MECLGENTILAFAQARLPTATLTEVEAHARKCAACHDLLRAALSLSGLAETAPTDLLGPTPTLRAPGRPPFEKGTSIGRYTVLELVGRGGMGEVYAAYDPGLDRRVALKLMHSGGGGSDPRGQERLLREGQAIAKLSHPNVVVVHDVGMFGDQVFVAMEYVDGSTLAAWLGERKRSWVEIVGMFIKAGRGLAAAHRAGFVHRDFKPQNVMVGRDGAVRVADFGLARRVDTGPTADDGAALLASAAQGETLTQTGVRVGTPYYMAPEQLAGRTADARSDQFSFCVALYWALTGTHPFGGGTPTEIATNLTAGKMPPTPGGVPPWLVRVVRRGLSPERDERWPTMDDLLAVLGRDRSTRGRRALYGAIALLLVGATGIATARSITSAPHFCLGGPGRLDGIWEAQGAGAGSRREKVHSAILRAGVKDPESTWDHVAMLLDQRATKWLAMYRDACEATRVRGEQSEEVLDLRMACLDDNLDSMRALTELISTSDRSVVDHAVEAAGALEDSSRCGSVATSQAGPRLPSDPLLRRKVQEARRRLKEGEALRSTGQEKRALEVADEVLSRPDVGGACPVSAEALALKAYALTLTQPGEVLAAAEDAILAGERCGDDRVVVGAIGSLIYRFPTDRASEADRWARLATAALSRLGGDPVLESWLVNNLGALRTREGRWEDARREFSRALEMKERTLGLSAIDVAKSSGNVGYALVKLGLFDDALAAMRRAKVIMTQQNMLETLDGAILLENFGDAYLGKGDLDDAEEAYRHADAVFLAHGATGMVTLQTLAGLASIALGRGRLDEAISGFEQALVAGPKFGVSPGEIAEVQVKLAMALRRRHPGSARARSLAEQAVATFARFQGFEPQRREALALLESIHRDTDAD